MTEDIAREMCAALLAAAAAAPKESQRESGALAALLRHADAHHPVAVSRAVTAALRPGQGAHLEQFLADALAGSPRAPLKGSPETVADAVDASNAALRARAVAALDACADVAWARAAALRRVQDDSHEVVIAALRTRLVREAPPEALATAAEGSLRVRVPVLLSRKPAKGADLDGCRGACKRLIKALGRVASEGGAVGSGALASMVDLLAVPAASQLRPVAVVAAEQLSKSGVLPFSAMGDVSKRCGLCLCPWRTAVSFGG